MDDDMDMDIRDRASDEEQDDAKSESSSLSGSSGKHGREPGDDNERPGKRARAAVDTRKPEAAPDIDDLLPITARSKGVWRYFRRPKVVECNYDWAPGCRTWQASNGTSNLRRHAKRCSACRRGLAAAEANAPKPAVVQIQTKIPLISPVSVTVQKAAAADFAMALVSGSVPTAFVDNKHLQRFCSRFGMTLPRRTAMTTLIDNHFDAFRLKVRSSIRVCARSLV
jgi:hypothetical protein